MKKDIKYIKVEPDKFSELDFKIRIGIAEIAKPLEKCECFVCEVDKLHHISRL